jgi:hypothetical protein
LVADHNDVDDTKPVGARLAREEAREVT